MAFLINSTEQNVTGGGSFAYDVGTSPNYIIVALSCRITMDYVSGVTLGGVAMTKLGYTGGIDVSVSLFGMINPGVSGSQTFAVSLNYWGGSSPRDIRATVYSGKVAGQPSFYGYAGQGSAAEHMYVSLDSGTDPAIGFSVCAVRTYGSNLSAYSGNTIDEDWEYDAGVGPSHYGGAITHQTTYPSVGSRTLGTTFFGIGAVGAVLVKVNDYLLEQSTAFSLQVQLPVATIAAPDSQIQQHGAFEFQIDLLKHHLTERYARQLPLVGTKWTPDRVAFASGLTTPMLSEVNLVPVWVEAPIPYVPRTRLIPLTTTGASGDPELVWDADDELVYTEYYE